MSEVKYDPRIEAEGHHLCHVLGENRGGEMSPKDRHDIFTTVRAVADYWKDKYDRMHRDNYEKRYKSLRRWIRENPEASLRDVQSIMLHLDVGEYVHDIKVGK